ncbi:MAG TPA: efflux RND transporter periplasmic adaptor subunit [Candidatus Polarisedimenticolaceae bacterium]|nr:efflux RND transporter periplasmic adaptor subunit [Candidatus Polarisedimenticolaceae bacterium]
MFRRLAAAAALVCLACGGKKEAPPAAPPDVLVTTVVQRDVPITKEWIGTLDGSVNAEIRPKVDGYVLRRAYQEGTVVHKGDLLFEIDARQFQSALDQATGAKERAQASLAKAERDVVRFTPLAAQKAISQQELDDAISARDFAKANLASASAQVEAARLNVAWTRVTAPVDGIAGIATTQVGDLVNPQTLMATVSIVDPILAVFNISETEYLKFASAINRASAGQQVREGASLELILSDGTVYREPGRVRTADRQVDVQTGTLAVKGEFANPGNLLRPGQYARVRGVVEERKGALLVPQRAISELQGSYMIGVVKPDGTADVRAVVAGPRLGNMWVIEKGLEPGDQVIVEGLQFVRPGAKVNAKPAPADQAPQS